MKNQGKKKKVIVGMSGGADSTAAAFFLLKQGYAVEGVFLSLYQNNKQKESWQDAKETTALLGIPLKMIHLEKEFQKKVIDYFLKEYAAGHTPNPCVICNSEIKFNFLLKKMAELKADFVATGHYAKIISKQISNKFTYNLYQAKDREKDQSYFLYSLKQKQLSKILFPLGNYYKEEVMNLVKKLRFPSANKKESQNICFVKEKYADNFLKKHLKLRPGKIIGTDGEVLGKHQGLPLYTIGQRRGIKVGGRGPYYVIGKDRKKNILLVSNNPDDPALYSRKIKLKSVNWIVQKPHLPLKTFVRVRYRNPLTPVVIEKLADKKRFYLVKFKQPQKAVAIGQAAVFYSPEGEILGGGTISD